MKQNYSHLDKVEYQPNQYYTNLLKKSTSRIFWQNAFLVTFMSYLEAIIMTAARRIKFIQNYQNPLK